MIVKVCGMRQPHNVAQVVAAGADMVGFIFYPPSPRYVGDEAELPDTPDGVERVGVFVDATEAAMVAQAARHSLTTLQLHGDETPELCRSLRRRGYRVIKCLRIASADDLAQAEAYHGAVDMLLFDTPCRGYGGSGIAFDWSLLDSYRGETPFLLSGGITAARADELRRLAHPRLMGVDINSGFEVSPAHKDASLVQQFIHYIKQ